VQVTAQEIRFHTSIYESSIRKSELITNHSWLSGSIERVEILNLKILDVVGVYSIREGERCYLGTIVERRRAFMLLINGPTENRPKYLEIAGHVTVMLLSMGASANSISKIGQNEKKSPVKER
jgi:hypothetical protein